VTIGVDGSIGDEGRGRSEATTLEDVLERFDQRPAWQRDALCREYAGRIDFFPGMGVSLEPAKSVCRRCLVRSACLEFALEHDERAGVWGGLSAKERVYRRLRRAG
jgi:WhiB family transcriptional regulator, redox-sensing transcriptional regulator